MNDRSLRRRLLNPYFTRFLKQNQLVCRMPRPFFLIRLSAKRVVRMPLKKKCPGISHPCLCTLVSQLVLLLLAIKQKTAKLASYTKPLIKTSESSLLWFLGGKKEARSNSFFTPFCFLNTGLRSQFLNSHIPRRNLENDSIFVF